MYGRVTHVCILSMYLLSDALYCWMYLPLEIEKLNSKDVFILTALDLGSFTTTLVFIVVKGNHNLAPKVRHESTIPRRIDPEEGVIPQLSAYRS